jgi:hypothetical protein
MLLYGASDQLHREHIFDLEGFGASCLDPVGTRLVT